MRQLAEKQSDMRLHGESIVLRYQMVVHVVRRLMDDSRNQEVDFIMR